MKGLALKDIISKFAHEPGIRGVFLIDEDQRFVGIISRMVIMKRTEPQLFGKWKRASIETII